MRAPVYGREDIILRLVIYFCMDGESDIRMKRVMRDKASQERIQPRIRRDKVSDRHYRIVF
jgi:hypothetical protein